MAEMICLPLRDTASPVEVHDEAVRRLVWQRTTSKQLAVASLVTDGPKHVALVETEGNVELPDVVGALNLWWEFSACVVLRGEITNEWRMSIGNTGHFGWQHLFANDFVVIPPESRQDRYHVPHGPDWHDTSRIVIHGGSLLLLAAPGIRPMNAVGVDLGEYIGGFEIMASQKPPRAIPELCADARLQIVHPELVTGVYQHHRSQGLRCRRGMLSLHLSSPVESRAALDVVGPGEHGPNLVEAAWSVDLRLVA